MSRRKKKSDSTPMSSWMDTYADTITLLLTFFILLYSISVIDSQKLQQLSKALQQALTGTTEVTKIEDIEKIKTTIDKSEKDKEKEKEKEEKNEYEDLVKKLNETIEKNSLAKVVKVRQEDRGVVLQLDETILFDPGRADLKEKSKKVLNIITKVIEDIDNDVLVEGNTDDVPMNTIEYPSNWELSTARAVSVARYFVENKNINPTRFSVKGYGEYKPLVKNNSVKNRAINRRVDILMLEERKTSK